MWDGLSEKPRSGSWVLGSEFTSDGATYAKLHRCLSDHFKIMPFERLYFEQPINAASLQGFTNADTLRLLGGIAAHAESFGAVKRLRMVKAISVSTWRKDFIGDMAVRSAKAEAKARKAAGSKSASATDQLKRLTIERCRQLGFAPRSNDEADALGILTYAILLDGVTPPWLSDEVLRPELAI